jgi:hypothetical protein
MFKLMFYGRPFMNLSGPATDTRKRGASPSTRHQPGGGVTPEYVALLVRCIGIENVTPSHLAALRQRAAFLRAPFISLQPLP